MIGFLAMAVVGLGAVAVGKYNSEHYNLQELQSSYSSISSGWECDKDLKLWLWWPHELFQDDQRVLRQR